MLIWSQISNKSFLSTQPSSPYHSPHWSTMHRLSIQEHFIHEIWQLCVIIVCLHSKSHILWFCSRLISRHWISGVCLTLIWYFASGPGSGSLVTWQVWQMAALPRKASQWILCTCTELECKQACASVPKVYLKEQGMVFVCCSMLNSLFVKDSFC